MNKRIFKRIMSLVLVMVMAVSTMMVSAVSTSAETTSAETNEYTYRLTFKTGDVEGGGVTSDVYLLAYNADGIQIGDKIAIKSKEKSFEEGGKYVQTIVLPEKMESFKIGGLFEKWYVFGDESWYLEYVKVEQLSDNKVVDTTVCNYNMWIKDNGYYASQNAMIPPDTKQYTYKVTIKTGNKNFAGTDADIYLNAYNADGEKILDKYKFDLIDNNFEKGNSDVLTINVSEKIANISINMVNSIKDDWYLEYVKTEVVEGSEDKETKIYHYDQWLSRDKSLNNAKEAVTDKIEAIYEKVYMYTMIIKTGTEFCAGTDSNIYFNAFDKELKQIGTKIKLDTPGNSFENGDEDIVMVTLPEKIDSFNISVDHLTAIKDKWFLDYIILQRCSYGELVENKTYNYDKWLG